MSGVRRDGLSIKTACQVEGCVALECVEVWPSVYVVKLNCGGAVVVGLVEVVGEEWPELVAEFRGECKWERVWRVVERLAEKHGVCGGWETYDACLREEVGRVSELVCEFLLGGFQKNPAELTRRTVAPKPSLLTTSGKPKWRQVAPRSDDKLPLDRDLDGVGHE